MDCDGMIEIPSPEMDVYMQHFVMGFIYLNPIFFGCDVYNYE